MLPAPAHPQRLVYLGTPESAVAPLTALVGEGFDVALVVSRGDKRRHRGGPPSPSPVKAAALELGLPVTTRVDDALDVGADLGVVVAFGRIIQSHVLARLPMVNLHFSKLPLWRGAAPVERAILAGDRVTGVSLMALDEGLDTGPLYRCEEVEISEGETLDELRGRLTEIGTRLLVETLKEGLGTPTAQQGRPSYAEKLTPGDLRLDWESPAPQLERVVRLGGAWTTFRGKRLKVLKAAAAEPGGDPVAPGRLEGVRVGTGDGVMELIEVQPEDRRAQPASAWLNGARPTADDRLGA